MRTGEGRLDHHDVLIVGAGIAGIGSAYHLKTQAPDKSFAILETQAAFGGTWRTHRYPGARSDSDLHTFGYRFKPWDGPPIATAGEILTYMEEVIRDHALEPHIQYRTRVERAEWSSDTNRWTLTVERLDTGEREQMTAGFLWMCQGYYRHDAGYTPEWPGVEDFGGRIVHPQTWPDDLDLAGKKVVVIGSGATAATLIPAIAKQAAHVTMLQRTPTWFATGRNRNELAEQLRELEIDPAWIHEIVRRQVLKEGATRTAAILAYPEAARTELLAAVTELVGPDVARDHFTPSYDPWRQRIAFVPDGDLFHAIKDGKADVVTDRIRRFVANGIETEGGTLVEADVVVTATGFELNVLGDIDMQIDGEPLDLSKSVTYRGMMFTGVPNLVWVFGYFRASWTLRADLVGDFVPRLLRHMDEHGWTRVEPRLRPEDEDMALGPWVDEAEFNPGYLTRGLHLMPRAGTKREWRHTQDYWGEKDEFPKIALDGPEFAYGR